MREDQFIVWRWEISLWLTKINFGGVYLCMPHLDPWLLPKEIYLLPSEDLVQDNLHIPTASGQVNEWISASSTWGPKYVWPWNIEICNIHGERRGWSCFVWSCVENQGFKYTKIWEACELHRPCSTAVSQRDRATDVLLYVCWSGHLPISGAGWMIPIHAWFFPTHKLMEELFDLAQAL